MFDADVEYKPQNAWPPMYELLFMVACNRADHIYFHAVVCSSSSTYIRQGDHHIGHWPTFLVNYDLHYSRWKNFFENIHVWLISGQTTTALHSFNGLFPGQPG